MYQRKSPSPSHSKNNNIRSGLPGKLGHGAAAATTTTANRGSLTTSNHSHGVQEDEAAQRKKLLEQLQMLGNHLAGSIVDFLIEEVEKKILNDYASAALADDSHVEGDGKDMDDSHQTHSSAQLDDSLMDNSLLSQATDQGEEEEDEEDESDDEDERRPGLGGINSLYGGGKPMGNQLKSAGKSFGGGSTLGKPFGTGNSYQQRMYGGGFQDNENGSSLGNTAGLSKNGGEKTNGSLKDSSPVLPSRGLRTTPGGGGQRSASPHRHTVQTIGPSKNQQKISMSGRPSIGALGFGDDDEEDDEDEEILGGKNPYLSSNQSATQNKKALGGSADGGGDSLRRNATLPSRLEAPSSPKPSLSPTRPIGKLDMGRFESSPARPKPKLKLDRSQTSSPRGASRFVSTDLDISEKSQNMEASEKSQKMGAPRIPSRVRDDRSPSPKQRGGRNKVDISRFESKPTRTNSASPKFPQSRFSSSSSPVPPSSRSSNSPSPVPNLAPERPSPKPVEEAMARPRSFRSSNRLARSGSVKRVMGMFESSEPRQPTNRNRPAMPVMRKNSVRNIMDSLQSEKGDDNADIEESMTNPNEAPGDDTADPNDKTPVRTNRPGLVARTRTPPKMPGRFTPNQTPDVSPKRGVQRNTSGIRMQRFLEKRPVVRSASGVRSFMGRKGSGSSTGSAKSLPARKWSGGGSRRGVERSSSRKGGRRGTLSRQFSFGKIKGNTKSSSFGMFAKDKVTNKLSHDARKQKRIFKTQNAMRKLKKATEERSAAILDQTEGSDTGFSDIAFGLESNSLTSVTLPSPCGIKHQCALLFVDISGFTQLSTKLKVEQLSKTINAYFQSIVEHTQAFGGDILKFAGDAVFVEWRATRSSLLDGSPDDPHDGTFGDGALGAEKAVITAAACAARIIDNCTDYDVFAEDGTKVATLNLHCAIGFGEVVGVHLGNGDRMEYFIIGEPIRQVAAAMDLGKMGEVVASPECLKYIDGKAAPEPKVILSKSNKFLNPKLMLVKPEKKKGNHGNFSDRLDDWDLQALTTLQKLMAPYVHPVIVDNQLLHKGYGSSQDRFTSEAELRDVFTVFIQPMVSSAVTGKLREDLKVLKTLHKILVVVSGELRRFKGQLRQYTVDDKGIVLIANFGLRGSTFPQMVEKLAMPFATNVQQILKAKLGVDSKMGATYGKAYCGVVGGLDRHEYAVLGPSVNLAARLMANKANKGFLVDEEVRRKASNRGFEGLAPVKAKGYKHLVPIFEPVQQHRNSWGSQGADFVGRTAEIEQILKLGEDIIDASSSTAMVWVSAESGYGKSALLAHAIEKIQDLAATKSATHVILCHVCSDADSFQPLSVVGPLCLDILAFVRRERNENMYKKPDGFDAIAKLAKVGSEHSPFQILGACRDAEVPDVYIRAICHLLLTQSWPTQVEDSARESQITEVARYIVTILLQSTIHLDFIALAVDDIPHADPLSWKVIELLHQYSCNFLLLMGSRPVVGADMNVDLLFWQQLNDEWKKEGSFLPLKLSAMTKTDLDLFVRKYASSKGWSDDLDLAAIAKDVFVHSGGVPQLAAQILERKSAKINGRSESPKRGTRRNGSKNNATSLDDRFSMSAANRQPSFSSIGGGSGHSGSVQVGEHMLHRMDLLSPETRTHINLGAILGPAFESDDVVSVMERYHGISDKDKRKHRQSVVDSLEQAAESGILEEDVAGAGNSMSFCAQENFMAGQESITYKFTHGDWRKQILKVVLDSWKHDMYVLLAESLEARFDFKSRRPDREIKKLFEPFKGGKKKGKNISVASELALKIGEKMIQSGKARYGLRIYQRALDYWLKEEEDILIFSEDDNEEPPEELEGEDLEYVIKLHAASGRCSTLLMDKDKSEASFQANLDLVPDSKKLKDPALLFPTFAGRFYSLRLTRKVEHEAELDFVYGFVEEAEAHKDQIHHLQALAMEAEVLGRNGEFDKALEACIDLRKQYNASTHSAQLVEIYGDDFCIQCLAQSATWHMKLSEFAKAIEVCDYIIEELPNLAAANCFLALYPLLWVLKDTRGQEKRALSLCQDHLPTREQANEKLDENSSENGDDDDNDDGDDDVPVKRDSNVVLETFSPFRCLHKPLAILLDLLSNGVTSGTPLEDYTTWALDAKKSEFDKSFNHYTGSVGRNADSITAEICLLLATSPRVGNAKRDLKARASKLVDGSLKLTKYMPTAHMQVKGFAHDKRFKGL